MGFMRKTLFVATGGLSGLVVRANSKKERTAKAVEKQARLQQQLAAQRNANAPQGKAVNVATTPGAVAASAARDARAAAKAAGASDDEAAAAAQEAANAAYAAWTPPA